METIGNIAAAARNSVFGESAITTQSGTEPPAADAPGKGTREIPYDPGNNTTPASKIDNPDPSAPSEMKSAVASNETANTVSKVTSNTSFETESKPKKTGTAQPGSHSALFGLGAEAERENVIHPPKSSRELGGTIQEAGEEMGKQAEMEKRGASEDDTGGYVGLKKAAMEEEEKRRNGGAAEGKALSAPAVVEEEEERDPRSFDKKNSLGREISPGEMPDGTHRKSIAEGMPQGHHFGRKNTAGNGEKTGGFRDRLKDKFRSKK